MAFTGKAVVITGSSFGIGRGTALAFGQDGASVTIHGRSLEGLSNCEKFLIENGIPEERILKVSGPAEDEATQKALIDETVKKFGSLDVLVNNAGAYFKEGLDTEIETLENFDYVFNLNVKAPVALTLLAIPHLIKSKGSIINISTAAAEGQTTSIMYYIASKHAQNSLTKSFATKLAKDGVRVNAVSPAIIDDTKILKKTDNVLAKTAATYYFNYISQYATPMKRAGLSKEVAAVVKFLASPEASYVTGSIVLCDGGFNSSMPSENPEDFPWHLAPKELLERKLAELQTQ
jgi:NAD(P)-dependent dehydrogenase (short-subunit alcohol dehydrogenase family)